MSRRRSSISHSRRAGRAAILASQYEKLIWRIAVYRPSRATFCRHVSVRVGDIYVWEADLRSELLSAAVIGTIRRRKVRHRKVRRRFPTLRFQGWAMWGQWLRTVVVVAVACAGASAARAQTEPDWKTRT